VLVVDDYQDCREMYAAWLSLAGFRVLTAGSGVEALKLAREFLPSIILMDLCLPGIDGCEVTRQLKADRATRHIPVIALTALSPPSPSRLATIGFESIILKPCLPDDLADHLARVLGSRRPISSDC
jgi:CheY-like chemotaxis protein